MRPCSYVCRGSTSCQHHQVLQGKGASCDNALLLFLKRALTWMPALIRLASSILRNPVVDTPRCIYVLCCKPSNCLHGACQL